jgi:hypothetical protein
MVFYFSFTEFRTRRMVAAEAVGVEEAHKSMIRRERALIHREEENEKRAWSHLERLNDLAHTLIYGIWFPP